MNFGDILKARRVFGKISLEELANMTGYSINTLKDFESNSVQPITYKDIPKGTLKDSNIALFNDYLKFCRLTEALRFDVDEIEEKIKSN